MGPRSADRGNSLTMPMYAPRLYASMGPRSADRGNAPTPGGVAAAPVPLQWGRDQLIAEMRQADDPVYGEIRLQWGRDQLIAEIHIGPRRGTPRKSLQWGRD